MRTAAVDEVRVVDRLCPQFSDLYERMSGKGESASEAHKDFSELYGEMSGKGESAIVRRTFVFFRLGATWPLMRWRTLSGLRTSWTSTAHCTHTHTHTHTHVRACTQSGQVVHRSRERGCPCSHKYCQISWRWSLTGRLKRDLFRRQRPLRIQPLRD